ncbi:MAG: ABC transporter ATP-binding protein [Alphaproteobacteria bacterium]|nr:ABC transporter ATP-binding protein [Alphaproteobacteria bacterium]
MTGEPILGISGLDISFTSYGQKSQILHDVSMHIDQGERVSLIGQSGSGKTVTMRTIIGTLPMPPAIIERGSIRFEGTELLTLDKRARNRLKGTGISIVLQDPMLSFNPLLTIGRQMDDVVRFADIRLNISRRRADRTARIHEVLRNVQLADPERICSAYPMMLSGGMRQRVLIGMALLNSPRLLIADEPGTALDVTTQQEILVLLNRLVDETGMSLMLITHNLGVVREMADRVYVMERGRIVETGTRAEIFNNPQHGYTRRLMEAVPSLYGSRVTDVTNERAEDAMIKVRDISKDFPLRSGLFNRQVGITRAVKDVELTINRGDIFGIAGESGSGKTTLAKMMLGLFDATDGAITMDKLNVHDAAGSRDFRKLVQIVYQNPGSSLNPKRTVADQLSVPLIFADFDRSTIAARIRELLELVDLPARYASMYPHELSGGQKQRVAIARALSVDPKILVLDEPTSALDVLIQNVVIDLLQRLRSELDLTYVFISHDLSLMRNFCNRVAIMFRGEICEQGETPDVFANPQHPYTRALLSAIPVLTDEEAAQKPIIEASERNAVLLSTTTLN